MSSESRSKLPEPFYDHLTNEKSLGISQLMVENNYHTRTSSDFEHKILDFELSITKLKHELEEKMKTIAEMTNGYTDLEIELNKAYAYIEMLETALIKAYSSLYKSVTTSNNVQNTLQSILPCIEGKINQLQTKPLEVIKMLYLQFLKFHKRPGCPSEIDENSNTADVYKNILPEDSFLQMLLRSSPNKFTRKKQQVGNNKNNEKRSWELTLPEKECSDRGSLWVPSRKDATNRTKNNCIFSFKPSKLFEENGCINKVPQGTSSSSILSEDSNCDVILQTGSNSSFSHIGQEITNNGTLLENLGSTTNNDDNKICILESTSLSRAYLKAKNKKHLSSLAKNLPEQVIKRNKTDPDNMFRNSKNDCQKQCQEKDNELPENSYDTQSSNIASFSSSSSCSPPCFYQHSYFSQRDPTTYQDEGCQDVPLRKRWTSSQCNLYLQSPHTDIKNSSNKSLMDAKKQSSSNKGRSTPLPIFESAILKEELLEYTSKNKNTLEKSPPFKSSSTTSFPLSPREFLSNEITHSNSNIPIEILKTKRENEPEKEEMVLNENVKKTFSMLPISSETDELKIDLIHCGNQKVLDEESKKALYCLDGFDNMNISFQNNCENIQETQEYNNGGPKTSSFWFDGLMDINSHDNDNPLKNLFLNKLLESLSVPSKTVSNGAYSKFKKINIQTTTNESNDPTCKKALLNNTKVLDEQHSIQSKPHLTSNKEKDIQCKEKIEEQTIPNLLLLLHNTKKNDTTLQTRLFKKGKKKKRHNNSPKCDTFSIQKKEIQNTIETPNSSKNNYANKKKKKKNKERISTKTRNGNDSNTIQLIDDLNNDCTNIKKSPIYKSSNEQPLTEEQRTHDHYIRPGNITPITTKQTLTQNISNNSINDDVYSLLAQEDNETSLLKDDDIIDFHNDIEFDTFSKPFGNFYHYTSSTMETNNKPDHMILQPSEIYKTAFRNSNQKSPLHLSQLPNSIIYQQHYPSPSSSSSSSHSNYYDTRSRYNTTSQINLINKQPVVMYSDPNIISTPAQNMSNSLKIINTNTATHRYSITPLKQSPLTKNAELSFFSVDHHHQPSSSNNTTTIYSYPAAPPPQFSINRCYNKKLIPFTKPLLQTSSLSVPPPHRMSMNHHPPSSSSIFSPLLVSHRTSNKNPLASLSTSRIIDTPQNNKQSYNNNKQHPKNILLTKENKYHTSLQQQSTISHSSSTNRFLSYNNNINKKQNQSSLTPTPLMNSTLLLRK